MHSFYDVVFPSSISPSHTLSLFLSLSLSLSLCIHTSTHEHTKQTLTHTHTHTITHTHTHTYVYVHICRFFVFDPAVNVNKLFYFKAEIKKGELFDPAGAVGYINFPAVTSVEPSSTTGRSSSLSLSVSLYVFLACSSYLYIYLYIYKYIPLYLWLMFCLLVLVDVFVYCCLWFVGVLVIGGFWGFWGCRKRICVSCEHVEAGV